MSRGLFITVEGGEGSGKTTQVRLLEKSITQAGYECVLTREPGGTPGAEAIRELLVKGEEAAWNPVSETLLFYAARSEHVEKLILPALAQGKILLCDRFNDSTLVYQGYAKGLGEAFVENIKNLTIGKLAPHATIILDIDVGQGLARTQARNNNETRFENMAQEFHQKVRDGFLTIAKKEPGRCLVVAAAQSEATVHKAIIAGLNEKLGLSLPAVTA